MGGGGGVLMYTVSWYVCVCVFFPAIVLGVFGHCLDDVWMVRNGRGVDSEVWVVAEEVLTHDGHIIVR